MRAFSLLILTSLLVARAASAQPLDSAAADALPTVAVRLIPEADRLLVLMLAPEAVLDREGPLTCSYALSIGREHHGWEQTFDHPWDAYDMGGVCVIDASTAFEGFNWPTSGPLVVEATLTIGDDTWQIAPTDHRVRERELSSTQRLVAALAAIGAQTTTGEASADFGAFHANDWTVTLDGDEVPIHAVIGLTRYLPTEACQCTQNECTICGNNHALTVFSPESPAAMRVIEVLRAELE